jgi:enoyl-CoA hydratase/carnithine racemase
MADELQIRNDGPLAFIAFNRPEKRNAVNDATVDALRAFLAEPGRDTRVIVLSGNGGHFSSGLDLSEHVARAPHEVMRHSRGWHAVTGMLRYSGLPVVAALNGAVMGGGLEIAACCHVRVAEEGTQFRMPEGQRGIFVGGGGSVRIAEIIGPDRLTEMMLTGRTYGAEEALALGLAHYVTPAGQGLAKATELAARIAENSPTVNYLITQAIPRISRMSEADGLFAESLTAALSQSGPDAAEGLKAFLEKRKPSFS